MGQTLAAKDQWYVVHVLSGQENKVRENILKRVKTEEMGDVVYDVLLPTERVSEIKKGKKTETTRKFFPGYLIVNMHLLDENNQLVGRTWYFIRNTSGVIGFAGTKDKPIPMRQSEVESMLAQMKEREEKVKPKVSFEVGETVKVADGPFQNQNGVVEEIDPAFLRSSHDGEPLLARDVLVRAPRAQREGRHLVAPEPGLRRAIAWLMDDRDARAEDQPREHVAPEVIAAQDELLAPALLPERGTEALPQAAHLRIVGRDHVGEDRGE